MNRTLLLAAGTAAVLALAGLNAAKAQDLDIGGDDAQASAQPDEMPAKQEQPITDPNGHAQVPVAPAVGAVAVPTAATVSIPQVGAAASQLPEGCVSTPAGGAFYYRCGDVWYQPRYEGTTVRYVVVRAP